MSKKDIELITVVVLGGALAWLWFTKSGKAAAASAGAAVANLARGIRNNNPGNIRISSNAWQGKIPEARNTDKVFEQFETMSDGVRALAKNLITYFDTYGLKTTRGIIGRYAPSSENDTRAYVIYVSQSLGVSPDVAINVRDQATLTKLVSAIVAFENGSQSGMNANDLNSGVSRALS